MPYAVLFLFVCYARAVLMGQPQAILSTEAPLSPAEISEMESTVRNSPADRDTRVRLLRHYANFAATAGSPSSFRAAQLGHVLYLIENYPADAIASSELTYVSGGGPTGDPSGHEAARAAWHRAVDRNSTDGQVVVNAARFLFREHPDEAERVLAGALERLPVNRKIAATLGFLYALDILGLSQPFGSAVRNETHGDARAEGARRELARTVNPFVLAGAGTALPNLFPTTQAARKPDSGGEVFAFAAELMARARRLGKSEPGLQGPMPLIAEFKEFQQR